MATGINADGVVAVVISLGVPTLSGVLWLVIRVSRIEQKATDLEKRTNLIAKDVSRLSRRRRN